MIKKQTSYSAERQVVLPSYYRIPIVPSYFGLFFGLVIFVLFIWIVNHQLNLGYLFVFLVFFIVFFSGIISVKIIEKLQISARDAASVFAGEDAFFPIVITENTGRQRSGFSLKNELGEVYCEGVDPNENAMFLLPQKTQKRGWQSLASFRIQTTLPLDLFFVWRRVTHLSANVLVYPKPSGNLPLPMVMQEGEDTHFMEQKSGDGFSGVSQYQLGQALSKIAWKQSLRGDMMVKDFSILGGQKILLDFSKLSGGVEAKLSQLSRWILDCEEQHLSYALRLPNEYVDFSSGSAHRDRCLQLLALY